MKVPKLCRQKTKFSDLAFVRITGKKFYCGVWGSHESRVNYLKLINQWTLAMTMNPPVDGDDDWYWEMPRKKRCLQSIIDHAKKHPLPPPPPPKTEVTIENVVAATLKQILPFVNPQPQIPPKPEITVTIN